MKNFKFLLSALAFSLLVLMLPTMASAQYRNDDDYWGNRRGGSYNYRVVGDAIRRIESRSDDFTRTLDRSLDRSRYDGRRREEQILQVAERFEDAAARLEDVFEGGRNMRRSQDEARNLLNLGSQLDRFVYNQGRQLDRRVENEWVSIRRDLQMIANAYGFNFGNDRGSRRDRDDDWRRDRRNNRFPF